jgi:cytochrome c biogenesis protein
MDTKKTPPDQSKDTASLVSQVASFFTSARTTITLLFILAAASVLGTLIPQEAGLAHFRETASPFAYSLIAILDLHSLFRSWWFLLLLALLALNILACLVRRLPAIPAEWRGEFPAESISFNTQDARGVKEVSSLLTPALNSLLSGSPEQTRDADKATTLIWVKHRMYLLGFPAMHAAILVILLGGLMGLMYGWKGSVQIEEEGSASQCRLIPSGRVHPLPFTIAVDKFTLTRYPTGQPKEFRSDVRLTKDGREVVKGSILVNHPLTFEGISLYQSDYRLLGIKEVRFNLVASDGKESEIALRPRTPVTITGSQYKVSLVSLDPGISKRGPGAEIAVQAAEGQPTNVKIFRDEPARLGESEIRFVDYTPLYATGLQVARDPGTVVVWIGCCALIVGFFLTLFTNYRRVTVRLTARGKGTEIKVSGRSRRQRREFREALEESIRTSLKPASK